MDRLCSTRTFGDWAYVFLLGASFASGFSMPTGRSLLAVSIVLLLVHFFRSHTRPVLPGLFWLWIVFVAAAGFSTAWGLDPANGFSKMSKLIWFAGIPVCATLITSFPRISAVLGAYAAGTGIEALRTIIWHPVLAVKSVHAGTQPDFMTALIDKGSMTYAQILMLGILVVLGFLLICRRENRSAFKWWILLLLQAAAMVMMFKRGSWVSVCLVVAVFLGVKTNWKYLLIMVVVVLSSLALPHVRIRLANLEREFKMDSGGRMAMWFKIAPVLIKEHPMGIGYRALTPEMMAKICPKVEPNRNHLHSNIAQILVETGWLGLAVYLLWMIKAIVDALRLAVMAARRSVAEEMLSTALLLMLVALFANGLVEYNFGDGEIVLAYGLILGCVAALRRIITSPAVSPASS